MLEYLSQCPIRRASNWPTTSCLRRQQSLDIFYRKDETLESSQVLKVVLSRLHIAYILRKMLLVASAIACQRKHGQSLDLTDDGRRSVKKIDWLDQLPS